MPEAPFYPCQHHPDHPAVVELDWSDDSELVCEPCILPRLRELHETLTDMELGEPEIRISVLPHDQ